MVKDVNGTNQDQISLAEFKTVMRALAQPRLEEMQTAFKDSLKQKYYIIKQ